MTADAIWEFQTKASDRLGDTVSPEGMLDMALRGTRGKKCEPPNLGNLAPSPDLVAGTFSY